MNILEETKNLIRKLQSLPESRRQSIFFTVILISALIIGVFVILSTKKNLLRMRESFKSIPLSKIYVSGPDFNDETKNQLINIPDIISIGNVSSDETNNIFKSQNNNSGL